MDLYITPSYARFPRFFSLIWTSTSFYDNSPTFSGFFFLQIEQRWYQHKVYKIWGLPNSFNPQNLDRYFLLERCMKISDEPSRDEAPGT